MDFDPSLSGEITVRGRSLSGPLASLSGTPYRKAAGATAVRETHQLMSKLIDVGTTFFKKRHPKVGARPGTLVITEDSPPPRIRMLSFNREQVQEQEVSDAQQLVTALDQEYLTWVDVQGFGDEPMIREIGKIFSIHPLAMEDVVNMPQRPKAEIYDCQVLVITRMVQMQDGSDVDMQQVTLVMGENYVLTFQERYGDVLEPIRRRIRTGKGRPIRRSGAGYLCYAIVDTIVDAYYPVIEALGDHLEQLENVVMDDPTDAALRELHRTKNMLVNLRRAIWPQREAVNSLIRDENPHISDEVRLYLRDTYDHCVQTAEVIEMYREMSTSLMNTYLSSIANRTNEVMKVLTIMASIFIPLTFLAGIYGMNFEHMPELQLEWAYPLVWTTMVALASGMIMFFWRKGWIGPQRSSASRLPSQHTKSRQEVS